jgi:hypothetical protein
MTRVSALLYFFVLAVGCDGRDGQTLRHRERVDGVDVVHSRVVVDADGADYACLASRSGTCHYLLAAPDGGGRRFSVPRDEELGGPAPGPGERLCVADAPPPTATCRAG